MPRPAVQSRPTIDGQTGRTTADLIAALTEQLSAAEDLFHPEGISILLHSDGSGSIITVGSDAEVFRFENAGELAGWLQSPRCDRAGWPGDSG